MSVARLKVLIFPNFLCRSHVRAGLFLGPASRHLTATMSSSTISSAVELDIKNRNIKSAPGVELSQEKKTLVGSVLDLFEGYPTLKKLSLWSPTATFTDPITTATGFDKYAAQWYGLAALFKPIAIQSHEVTSGDNPVEVSLRNKYTVKGIRKETVIESVVKIYRGGDGKIERVEDRWNGKLPEGAVSEAFRKLNAVVVPTMVRVPKSDAEDMKMKAEREQEK